jgi:hypothetical protein
MGKPWPPRAQEYQGPGARLLDQGREAVNIEQWKISYDLNFA